MALTIYEGNTEFTIMVDRKCCGTKAPRPQLKEDELLIRVHAAGVNPLDWKARSGSLNGSARRALPLIPGWDVSGVVEKVGRRVSRFKRGNQVVEAQPLPRLQSWWRRVLI